MSALQDLKSRLRDRIHTTRALLTEITTPVKSPSQEIANEEYIRRLNEMTLDANTDLLDIEADYGNDIDATELEAFKLSLYNIERETSTIYNDLCAWKVYSSMPPTIEACRLREATEKAKADYTNIQADHDTLKQEVTQYSS